MTVKIGLIADVHATAAPVKEALEIFGNEGIDTILCAGDIAGYGTELEETVALLIDGGCRTVAGNHDIWWRARFDRGTETPVASYLRGLPMTMELSVAGKRITMVHASPPESLLDGIRLLDEDGALIPSQKKYWTERLASFPGDVLVVGHTHQVFSEQLGIALVVNPGSTRFNHTCAILTLPDLDVRSIPLGGRTPVPAWNWSMEAGSLPAEDPKN